MAAAAPARGVAHRAGSRAQLIEQFTDAFISNYRGTPTLIATFATQRFGFVVTRHDVGRALHNLRMSRKVVSPVPSLADRSARARYLQIMNSRLTNMAQLVFLDEKKLKDNEFQTRYTTTGYAPVGARLPTTLRAPPVRPQIGRCEIIAAISVVMPAPLVGDPTRTGDIGVIAYKLCTPRLGKPEIIDFIINVLPPLLNPFPGPRSVLVMDNMPEHREQEDVFRAAIEARGAVLVFQPAQSPDLNPIEKLWDVLVSGAHRRSLQAVAGMLGVSHQFTMAELQGLIWELRLTRHALQQCGFTMP